MAEEHLKTCQITLAASEQSITTTTTKKEM